MTAQHSSPLSPPDYQRLAVARAALARFQRQGEERARELGLTHAQHHLLLAVHTHPGPPPGVGHVAGQLSLRQHSAAGLVDRAAAGATCTGRRTPATAAGCSYTCPRSPKDNSPYCAPRTWTTSMTSSTP